MTLSIDRVTTRMSFTEAAAILSGQRLAGVDLGYQLSDELIKWRRRIADAVVLGEMPGCIQDGNKPPSEGYEFLFSDGPWGNVEKHDLVDWLVVQGFYEEEIPNEILNFPGARRGMPLSKSGPEKQEKPSHLLTIAALVELLIKSEKPGYNQSRIIDSIAGDPRNKDLIGLSESNLNKLFSKANKALEEARKDV
ncbi:MAG: hypothetical protein ACQEUY_07740 [Pseudomonadota bacterium]